MDFDALFAQVIILLQSEQRISYRVLKRRFALSDDDLADLTDELIYAKKLAIDEENRVLVWTGDMASGQAVAPQPAQATPQPAAQVQPSTQVTPRVTTSPPDAERRQLTVMFCDLVDSTKLSSQLDPEEYRDVVRAYQGVCSEVITRFDGHIAQLLGDGLLVYFGYPHAHEDDAQRAVRTGLGILDAMEALRTRLQQDKGIQLAVRLGIHTGLVVVGAMGSTGRQEQLALGETPNVAARIQGLAEPNTLVISEATHRLVQGYFACQALGAQTLRGVGEPITAYRVLRERGVQSRLDIVSARGLAPLVGREQDVGLLLERWAQVKDGQGQVVLLTGDAGIGKSRLVQVLKEHVAHEPHTRWECRNAEYFQNTALFPLTDLFQRIWRFEAHETPDEKLGKLEQMLSQYRLPVEESVQLLAPLLSLPIPDDRYPPLHLSPQRQRQKTLESIGAMLLELAEQQPVLFILEDLHWTDPTTLELLGLLLDQTPTASMLVLLTSRPHFQPAWHHRSYLSEITVNRLTHTQVEQIVAGMTNGKTFPAEVLQQIIAKTDGVPLFVEEMTKAILESGQLKAFDKHYELTGSFSTLAIPTTLQDSLMARLDRLVTAKAVAQYAAVIGRQFSYALLQAVSQLDAVILQRELGRLVEAEIVYQRGMPPQATYTFKHALIQDAAYESLLKSTRQQYHQRIAEVLVAQFPETAETQPELLAYHYTAAEYWEHAVGYWQRAGTRAVQRSAYTDAVQHLTRGLHLLARLPETPGRAQQELDLHLTLGIALVATKGQAASEVEQTYLRARALCTQVGDTPQRFLTLWGLQRFYRNRGALSTARELGEQLVGLAQRAGDPMQRLEAHDALGATLFALGDYAAARPHLEQAIVLTAPTTQRALALRYGIASGVRCLAVAANALWRLGFPDQAMQRSWEALALAQELAHPLSLMSAQYWAAWLHYVRREVSVVQALTDTLLTLATTQGFPLYVGYGTCWRGWALVMQGEGGAGLAQLRQGMAAILAAGHESARSLCLFLLAEASGHAGQVADGLDLVTEALTAFETSQRGDMLTEAHRCRGELMLRQALPEAAQAQAYFQQALAVARRQQAKSFELRAATSLARLWQQHGKRQAAHDLLAPVYGWFTEGFDTADLQDARSLLDALT
jgi:class 3 adenylate cyclase/predicted ATPase/energy-coupling factor transporter ATP-binding protein EcfA2